MQFLTGYLMEQSLSRDNRFGIALRMPKVMVGLAVVLVFIGIKMLLEPHGRHHTQRLWFQVDIPTTVSLGVVAAIIALSIGVSVMTAWRPRRRSDLCSWTAAASPKH